MVVRAEGLWTRWRRLERRLVASVWREARFFTDAEIETALRAAGFQPRASRRVVHYGPWPPVAAWARQSERIAGRWCLGLATVLAVGTEPDRAPNGRQPGTAAASKLVRRGPTRG